MIKTKKAQGMPLSMLIVALILITTAIIIIASFTGFWKTEGNELDNQIGKVDDCDEDGIANMFDKCPCDDKNEDGCKAKLTDPKSCSCE